MFYIWCITLGLMAIREFSHYLQMSAERKQRLELVKILKSSSLSEYTAGAKTRRQSNYLKDKVESHQTIPDDEGDEQS